MYGVASIGAITTTVSSAYLAGGLQRHLSYYIEEEEKEEEREEWMRRRDIYRNVQHVGKGIEKGEGREGEKGERELKREMKEIRGGMGYFFMAAQWNLLFSLFAFLELFLYCKIDVKCCSSLPKLCNSLP